MNEEEVKVRILLPYLASLGLSPEHLTLEHTFSIRIGHHSVLIGAARRENERLQGRLDILVSRHEKNLVIIEVKRESASLTDDDRDQAISYARLVHPMAPYAVVTNGVEWQLFDVVTKNKVENNELRFEGNLGVALPEEDLLEAQRIFLTCNRANLDIFCKKQVSSNTAHISGEISDSWKKKYVPDLHVPNHKLLENLDNFFRQSEFPIFVVLGKPGVGKTSSLCHLANSLLENNHPTIFFDGMLLEEGIPKAISDEFAWTFSEQQGQITLLRRLHSILANENLAIIIDGIDNWAYEQRIQNLVNLARHFRDNQLKLVISCKSSTWKEFLEIQGNPTGLARLVYPTAGTAHDKLIDDEIPGYELAVWTDREFFEALRNYRRAFDFRGGIEDRILVDAKTNPFLLRIVFEVAASTKLSHVTYSSFEIFEHYYQNMLARTRDPDVSKNILLTVARCIFDQDMDSVDASFVRSRLELRATERLPSEPFDVGLLFRTPWSNDNRIGFYFEQLRNFVLAFHVLRLQEMNEDEFRAIVPTLKVDKVRRELLTFYYGLAGASHKRAIDGSLRENATLFLMRYREILETHFPRLRDRFLPLTKGDIGLVAQLYVAEQYIGFYGFRKKTGAGEDVLFVAHDGSGNSNVYYLYGAARLVSRSTADGFRSSGTLDALLESELIDQLKDIVAMGDMFEGMSSEMMLENLALAYFALTSRRDQHHKHPDYILPERVSIVDIARSLKEEKLRRHFEHIRVENLRQLGYIKEDWNGAMVAYSYSFSRQDKDWIEDQVVSALNNPVDAESLVQYVHLTKIDAVLAHLSDSCLDLETTYDLTAYKQMARVIEQIRLRRDIPIGEVRRLVGDLMTSFISSYRLTIEANFPSMRDVFVLYNHMPLTIYAAVGEIATYGPRISEYPVQFYYCKDTHENTNRVITCDASELLIQGRHLNYQSDQVDLLWSTNTTLENFIVYNTKNYANLDFGSTKVPVSPIRALVYRQIEMELGKALRAIPKLVSLSAENIPTT